MLYAYKKDNEWIAITPDEYKNLLGISIPPSRYEEKGLFQVETKDPQFSSGRIPSKQTIVEIDGRPVLDWIERKQIPEDEARIRNFLNRQIDQERDRRVIQSEAFEINGKTLVMDGRPNTLATLNTMATLASITNESIEYRDSNNVHHHLEAIEIIELFTQVTRFNNALARAAWHLKSLNELPEDYQDDKWWI